MHRQKVFHQYPRRSCLEFILILHESEGAFQPLRQPPEDLIGECRHYLETFDLNLKQTPRVLKPIDFGAAVLRMDVHSI